MAAIQYHGYYQSSDGATWTRMISQPGTKLTTSLCPTNIGKIGSTGCPIFRGSLAVNPISGDTFAWSVDLNNQDQGLWRDTCGLTSGACASSAVSFATQLSTASLETSTTSGSATIVAGDYTLALAAIPASLTYGSDTILLAGAQDLWRCSLSAGCVLPECAGRRVSTCFGSQCQQPAPSLYRQ